MNVFQYENEYWNGEYKTIEDGLLKADLLGFNANKRKVTSSSPWKPETGQLACGKSFIVYENMVDAVKPGQRTLLVLKGTYTDDNGRVEENRFYTIPVNAMGTMTDAEGGTPDHSCVKRNYRYNISLTINSSGSDRPYDPVTEACMDVAVTVADWDVIEQNEDLD